MRSILGICSGLLLLALAAPARAERTSLAVLPLEWGKRAPGRWRHDLSPDALSRALVTAFTKTQKFDVLERAKLDEVLAEQKLTRDGLTDPKRAARLGKLIGADYLLLATISGWELEDVRKRVPIAETWLHTCTLRLAVDLRLVAAETGKIVLAETVRCEDSWRVELKADQPMGIPADRRDAIQTAALRAIIEHVLGVFPVKVVLVKDGVVYLNYGEGTGLAVGQVLDVIRQGEAVKDPDSGEELGREEARIGRIKVTKVEAKLSRAELIEGVAEKGAVCRPLKGDPKEWPPVERPAPR
ncbi:MAG: CsgG/HfaB family protein [Planctomycetota bacterium]